MAHTTIGIERIFLRCFSCVCVNSISTQTHEQAHLIAQKNAAFWTCACYFCVRKCTNQHTKSRSMQCVICVASQHMHVFTYYCSKKLLGDRSSKLKKNKVKLIYFNSNRYSGPIDRKIPSISQSRYVSSGLFLSVAWKTILVICYPWMYSFSFLTSVATHIRVRKWSGWKVNLRTIVLCGD